MKNQVGLALFYVIEKSRNKKLTTLIKFCKTIDKKFKACKAYFPSLTEGNI